MYSGVATKCSLALLGGNGAGKTTGSAVWKTPGPPQLSVWMAHHLPENGSSKSGCAELLVFITDFLSSSYGRSEPVLVLTPRQPAR